jgi:pimeloyl-ACP methyl ester carboxylesterase
MVGGKLIPLYVEDCFGWIHLAGGSRGAIICSAYGVEELCTHRFMRHLASELAAAGLPTLRFDYRGTGDSPGTDADPDRVKCWLDDIRNAVQWLKQTTGVNEIALVGFRLGALLTADIAAEISGISHLVLMDAPVAGNAHLREMKALGILSAEGNRSSTPAPEREGYVEVAGFYLTPATCAELKQIDLLKLPHPPAAQILLAGKRLSKNHDRIEAHLRAMNCNVERMTIPGYDELVWNSSFADLPPDAFHSLVQWTAQGISINGTRTMDRAITQLSAGGWRESPVLFGDKGDLFGVLCNPEKGTEREVRENVVVFLNHGSNHHIGWARMHVLFAREFAASGFSSLRMDISGIGDSLAQPGQQENQLYARYTQFDVYAAIDWLKGQGYQSIAVIGHCAGAHLAFYSAVRDQRITALVMLNLQRFFWARGESLEVATQQSFRSSGWYWAGLSDLSMWRRLFKGQINVRGIAAAMIHRIWQRTYASVDWIKELVLGKAGSYSKVYHWLRELVTRGAHVLFIYSADDGGVDEMEKYLGKKAGRARKLSNVNFRTIVDADHNLTSASSRQRYAQMLLEFLTNSK